MARLSAAVWGWPQLCPCRDLRSTDFHSASVLEKHNKLAREKDAHQGVSAEKKVMTKLRQMQQKAAAESCE